MRVKAKFDNLLNAEVFTEMNLGSGVYVAASVGGNF